MCSSGQPNSFPSLGNISVQFDPAAKSLEGNLGGGALKANMGGWFKMVEYYDQLHGEINNRVKLQGVISVNVTIVGGARIDHAADPRQQ